MVNCLISERSGTLVAVRVRLLALSMHRICIPGILAIGVDEPTQCSSLQFSASSAIMFCVEVKAVDLRAGTHDFLRMDLHNGAVRSVDKVIRTMWHLLPSLPRARESARKWS
jgi:hypothetical protein